MEGDLFSAGQGIWMIAGYAAIMYFLAWFFTRRYRFTKDGFLVAYRQVGQWQSAFSIAATWIWAPALFIAAQKAYTQGLAGVFWFTVPNVLCLIVFGYFAVRLREKMPEGYTLSDYMRETYSNRVHNIYGFQLTGLATCSFAVQLLAGGLVVSTLTGIDFALVTVIMALIALGYSAFSGFKASVITDYAQMAFIGLIGFTLVPWAVMKAGGLGAIAAGFGGKTGTFGSIFSGDGGSVFFTFGIAVTIGLMAGPFGDQSFWQRGFATKRNEVKRAFIKGAFIFATVPVLMSLLGFVAAGERMAVGNVQLVNLQVILKYLPFWTVVPFVYMLLSGLVSTLDSNLCAISGIGGHDLLRRMNREGEEMSLGAARISMVVLALAAVLIANIPGMKILYLFLFYGTLRASTLLPTVLTILKGRLSERGVFWGVLVSICVGLPIFAYGNFNKITPIVIVGSLVTVLSSGAIAYLMTLVERTRVDVAPQTGRI